MYFVFCIYDKVVSLTMAIGAGFRTPDGTYWTLDVKPDMSVRVVGVFGRCRKDDVECV